LFGILVDHRGGPAKVMTISVTLPMQVAALVLAGRYRLMTTSNAGATVL